MPDESPAAAVRVIKRRITAEQSKQAAAGPETSGRGSGTARGAGMRAGSGWGDGLGPGDAIEEAE